MGTRNGVIITITSGQGDDSEPKAGSVQDAQTRHDYSYLNQYFHNDADHNRKGTPGDPNGTLVTFDLRDGVVSNIHNATFPP